MTVYSHSRLSCFEQCPYKYKLHYIDRVETEVAESIEAFLGSRVHQVLEKLYDDLRFQKLDTLDELLIFLYKVWTKEWDDSIQIVKKEYTAQNYLKMAEKYISDYYRRYHPFDQGRTIALEEQIRITLDERGQYLLQGYIDRLSEADDGCYEIHDYKTNARLPLAEYIHTDRQLALYMIGVKNCYPDVKDVRLIWHFLAFDKEIDSTRSDVELESLKHETIALIDRIESEERFVTCPSFLCEWCEFKSVCPQWKHLYRVEEKPKAEYASDSGVMLVDRYVELKQRQRQMNAEMNEEVEKLEQALIGFAEKESVECVFGSAHKVRVTGSERYLFPAKHSAKRKELEAVLAHFGKLSLVQQLDTSALGKMIEEKALDTKMLAALKEFVEVQQSKRLYVSKLKEP